MRLLKQSSTAQPLLFLMVSSTDHVTPVTGLTPTVTLSKAGASFASPSGAVTEIGNGWYKVAGNATDTGTLGPLVLHAAGTAADPSDIYFDIIGFDPQVVNLAANLKQVNGSTATASGAVNFPNDTLAGQVDTNTLGTGITAIYSSLLGGVVVTTNNDKTGYSLTQTFPTNFSSLGISAGGKINGVILTDTLTTYTNDTPQTGDSYARIGVTGSGLTSLAQASVWTSTLATNIGTTNTRVDVTLSTRMATYTQPTGFLAATFPTGTVANTTNITAGTITTTTNLTNAPTAGDFTSTMKISLGTAVGVAQTGDSYARIGATGSGLTSLAPSATALSTVTWTGTLATNIGTTNTRVDVASSTLAPASTALSTAVWTSARAAFIDIAISSRSTYAGADTPGTTELVSTLQLVSGSTYQFTASALSLAPSGSGLTAQQTRDAMTLAPTAGTPGAGSIDADLNTIIAKTNLIVVGGVTVVSPVSADGQTITLIQGDDYKDADGRAVTLTSGGWPVLSGGSISMRVAGFINYTFTVSDASTITRDFTSAETGAMTVGEYDYSIVATLSNGDIVTLAEGFQSNGEGFIIAKQIRSAS